MRGLRIRQKKSPGLTGPEVVAANPDHAWKLLGLVNEWIRHSDSKAAVTLAFTGAMATLLFNLARSIEARTSIVDVLVVVSCVLIAVTGAFCGLTLTPRVNDEDADPEAINRIFFVSIAANYKGRRPEYTDVLRTLSADADELIKDLADQIHANAKIATIKARYAKWAIRAGLAAGSSIALSAIFIGTSNT